MSIRTRSTVTLSPCRTVIRDLVFFSAWLAQNMLVLLVVRVGPA